MIPDPGGLQTYLNGRTTYDWYETFAIQQPGVGWTTFATNGNPPVRRGRMRSVLGREVATCEFAILCGAASGLMSSAMSGAWDGAPIVVNRVFNGSIVLERFRGYVSDVRPTASTIEVVAKSLLAELTTKVPIRSFSTYCPYVFGASGSCDSTSPTPCDQTRGTCTGSFGGFVTIPSSVP